MKRTEEKKTVMRKMKRMDEKKTGGEDEEDGRRL
jgi:hypothetical protein